MENHTLQPSDVDITKLPTITGLPIMQEGSTFSLIIATLPLYLKAQKQDFDAMIDEAEFARFLRKDAELNRHYDAIRVRLVQLSVLSVKQIGHKLVEMQARGLVIRSGVTLREYAPKIVITQALLDFYRKAAKT